MPTRRSRHVSVIGVVAVLLGTGVPPASGASSTGSAAPAVPTLEWQACGEDFPGLQCSTAVVPLDHDEPDGETTELALARRPATDVDNRIGTVFVNPGGPGGSGVDMVLFGFGEFLGDGLEGRFDVVGFDPRGVAGSDPLRCFDSVEELGDFFVDLPVFPYQRPQERPFYDRYASLGPRCQDQGGEIVRHMSTADVARDLDLLREAVGDEQLTYLGFSYGSYLGNTYANLFPDRVRALVIDGVLDPELWSRGQQIRSDRVATQEEFDEFLRLCDAAADDCAFASPQGSRSRWEALAEALEQEPLVVDDAFTYTYDFLVADAVGAMYAPESWGGPQGAAALFDLLADAVLGDQQSAREVPHARERLLDRLTPPSREPEYPNGFDAYYGNQCADTEYPRTFRQYANLGRYAGARSRFGPFWWWANAGCADWPVAEDRYTGPWTARTSSPVLVVGNYFDGVTDHAGARASARNLEGSRLLSYAGWGHTAYGRSACVTEHIDAYLLDGTLPPKGKVCPANPNPFVPQMQLRATTSAPLVGLPAVRPGRRG